MKKSLLEKTTFALLLLSVNLGLAQNVGIGTSTPQQKLHVAGVGQTIRVDGLSGVGTRSVYVTPLGDLTFTAGSLAPEWLTLGNGSTVAGTNFIGTTDGIDFVTKTTAIERSRITAAGQFNVNCITPFAGDVFAAYGTGYTGAISATNNSAINGYVNAAAGIGVYGENATGSAMVGLSNVNGIYGQINSTVATGNAVWGDNFGTGVAVRGQATNTAGGIGLIGFTAIQAGVQGQCASTGDAIRGFQTLNGVNAGDAIFGQAVFGGGASFPSSGVFGYNSASSGIGILGAVGPVGIIGLSVGTGGNFSGAKIGMLGFVGLDSTLNGTNTSAGGYFYCNQNAFAYCGARISGTNYKVTGTGTAGTFVRDLKNQYRIMACPEAPEILFQDYGIGKLTNGEAYITIDPILAKNILVDESHPLKIFIQLEDDCNGVYVTEKSQIGFKVKELANGTANAKFAWSLVANRADEKDLNGKIVSFNANNRFVVAPPMETFMRKTPKTNLRIESILNAPETKTFHSQK